jgi:hypothetical protein
MNKLLIYIGIITVVSITACSNDNVVDNVIEKEQTLSFDKSLKFKNVVDSINKNCYGYIRSGKTRAANNGTPKDLILTLQEEKVLKANEKVLVDASYDLFESIGLSKEEIKNEIGEENDEVVVYASLIAMSVVHDNNIITRGITGNVYLDCALDVLGLDMFTVLRTAMTEGVSKKIALKLLKRVASTALGSSVVLTVGLWGVCIGIS